MPEIVFLDDPYDGPDGPDLPPDDEGNDSDACGCADDFIALVTHSKWNITLYYECLACGARWHYWEEGSIAPDKRAFAEALITQRRKS